jgi:transglutaminase-like putative cysteine protease
MASIMSRLIIRHETRYSYDWAVRFSPHRLLMRPRDSHAVRLLQASLELSPTGATRWVYDALGNCVCLFTPASASTELCIVSNLVIERFPSPLAPLAMDNPHTASPIVYGAADRAVLEPFMIPASPDDDPILLEWVRSHMGHHDEPVLDFLQRLNGSIKAEFTYNERGEEGVQIPSRTLWLKSGSCRDFAWLMVESLRRLGYAARFVTGYLYSPANSDVRGGGATHAWCEVFLPSLGWMEFDPTNGLAESADLIAIATVRTPEEASPVSGRIIGNPGRSNLSVSVSVTVAEPQSQAAA